MNEYVEIIWMGASKEFSTTIGKFKKRRVRRVTEADAVWLMTLSNNFEVSEVVYNKEGEEIRVFSPVSVGIFNLSDNEKPLDIGIARSYGLGDMFLAAQFACRNAKAQNPENKVTFYVPSKYMKIFRLFPFIDAVENYPPSFSTQREHDKYIDLTRTPQFHSNDSRNECRAEIFASIFKDPTFEYNPLEIPSNYIEKAQQFIEERNTDNRKIIALATTSLSQIKTYPAIFLRELIEELTKEYFVIMYGIDEHNWGLKQWNGKNLLSMIDKTPDYIELAAFLSQSDYGIATDSGLMHLLAMLKIRTLALFGNLDPMAMIKYYPSVTALYPKGELSCIPCGNRFNPCPKTDQPFGGACLNLLSSARVITAFRESILELKDSEQKLFRKILRMNENIQTSPHKAVSQYTPSKTPMKEKSKYKVLIVVPHIFMGGGETQLLYLLDTFDEYDFDVEIIVMGTIDEELFPILEEKAKVGVMASEGNKINMLRRKITDEDIDIVLFHGTDSVQKALEGIKKKPIVVQILHTGVGTWTVDILQKTAIYDDHAIAVAEWIRKKFQLQYPYLNITAINNGVPAIEVGEGESFREELGINEEDFVIGTMSRFGVEKRLYLLIEALEHLPSNVSLLLAGWGKQEDTLKEIAEKTVPGRVKFAGVVHDREKFFRSVDCCALVSIAEGNSVFLLESAMARQPIITTPVGASPDLFRDKHSAMFVEGEPDSIAEAVIELMRNKGFCEILGDNARHTVERVASDMSMSNGYRMIFQQELSRRIHPRHILAFRAGGYGDMMMTIPALRVLRNRYPDAIITFAVGEQYKEILEGIPYIDHLYVDNHIAFRKLAHNYDLAFDFQHYDVWRTRQHIIDHYLDLVDAPKKADRSLEINLSGIRVFSIEPPYVCVHTTSNFKCKNWGTEEEWKQIIKYLQKKYTVVQIGDFTEPDYGGIMFSDKKLSPKETISIIKGSEFLLGIDSFPVHGAKAVECLSAVIYGGSSHPDFCGYKENENIVSPSPCKCDLSKTSMAECSRGLICLKSITIDDIIGAIQVIERR